MRNKRVIVKRFMDVGLSCFTTVELTLSATEKGTLLELRESGYKNTPEGLQAMLDCVVGWGEALTL